MFMMAGATSFLALACHDLDAFQPTLPVDASLDVTQPDARASDALDSDVRESDVRDASEECSQDMVFVHGNCQVAPLSCATLDRSCGPDATDYCCATSTVEGGILALGWDEGSQHPDTPPGFQLESTLPMATVSSYMLDDFEVTVGRFREFMTAYDDWHMGSGNPADGDGENPNHLIQQSDGGTVGAWEARWSSSPDVGANAGDIITSLDTTCDNCNGGDGTKGTWTDLPGPNESLPMTCMNWYEAYMFCIWDGARLPTDAEWELAAGDGSEQRAYPWSQPSSSIAGAASLAVISPLFAATKRVGSLPGGVGAFGQYDLAGNAYEWVMDAPVDPSTYNIQSDSSNPLDLSGELAATSVDAVNRSLRGGSFDWPSNYARTSARSIQLAQCRYRDVGVRCARPAIDAK